jgi:hypothetical protein
MIYVEDDMERGEMKAACQICDCKTVGRLSGVVEGEIAGLLQADVS